MREGGQLLWTLDSPVYPKVIGTNSGCRSPLQGRGWARGLWAGPGCMLWPNAALAVWPAQIA